MRQPKDKQRMGIVIARSSETSVRTYQTICFLFQVATTKYEIKDLFYRPQILYKIPFGNLTYFRTLGRPRRR